MTGIGAVTARMAELDAILRPTTTTAGTAPASSSALSSASAAGVDFDAVLAALAEVGTATTSAADGGPTGEDLVAAAREYLGVPYVWGGESLAEGGLDCSGLVLRSLADIGVTDVPRTARQQMSMGSPVASLAEARAGDLVVFGGGTHIGIYLGDGRMIDAPSPGRTVTTRDVYTEPTAIRRVLPAATESAADTIALSTQTVSALVAAATGRGALGLSASGGLFTGSGLTGSGGLTGTGVSGATGTSALLAGLLGVS